MYVARYHFSQGSMMSMMGLFCQDTANCMLDISSYFVVEVPEGCVGNL